MSGRYEADYYAWAVEQAALLRQGRIGDADIANIAEELEDLGKAEKRELRNRLAVLLAHLLKWQAQPLKRSRSWRLTIAEQRLRLAQHLDENPSLRATLEETTAQAWRRAAIKAARQTGLDNLPTDCPWPAERVIDDDFWPESEEPAKGIARSGR